ncbi:hypothetical protein Nepgr_011536 [Nepenthes gracilis]|uniref:Uncharacterized protein n=1 Tax=Nepenthes gracilis TaxID=150966 RepID=A0AAD3SE88_NEPGR|nr:hypothetical protein Nepgr_011536 [Nepenthes gracilis]
MESDSGISLQPEVYLKAARGVLLGGCLGLDHKEKMSHQIIDRALAMFYHGPKKISNLVDFSKFSLCRRISGKAGALALIHEKRLLYNLEPHVHSG